MEKLNDILFYNLDKAIRSYRHYAQKRLREHGYNITIDQWLTIKALLENPGILQQELAGKIFKDNASVTRILDLLVKAGYVTREVNPEDRRKTLLEVTPTGVEIIRNVQALVLENRAVALSGIDTAQLEVTDAVLRAISHNCS